MKHGLFCLGPVWGVMDPTLMFTVCLQSAAASTISGLSDCINKSTRPLVLIILVPCFDAVMVSWKESAAGGGSRREKMEKKLMEYDRLK